jgi:hypothetical protein
VEDRLVKEPVLEINVREDDPLFGHALELANEVVASLVYWVVEPNDANSSALPILSAVVEEVDRFPDARLLGMFTFALGRCARNLAASLARERGCSLEAVLREFLLQPVQ